MRRSDNFQPNGTDFLMRIVTNGEHLVLPRLALTKQQPKQKQTPTTEGPRLILSAISTKKLNVTSALI